MFSFGMSNYKATFEAKDLWPESGMQLLENIGIYVYCMGFILFLLTQYVCNPLIMIITRIAYYSSFIGRNTFVVIAVRE